MKAQIISTELLPVLEEAMLSIKAKSSMFILENFYWIINKESMIIRSTDLSTYYENTIPITSNEEKSFLIPAKLTYDLIKSLSDDKALLDVLDLELRDNKLKFKNAEKNFNISISENVEDYPEFPAEINKEIINISADKLNSAIDFTFNQIADDELRPSLAAMNLSLSEKINAVSTDGRVLAFFVVDKNDSGTTVDFLLPKDSVGRILKLKWKFFNICADGNLLEIKNNNGRFIIRLVGERYPNYQKVIPVDNKNAVIFNRVELLKSIKRIHLFNEFNTPTIKFQFSDSDNSTALVSAENPSNGSSGEDRVSCKYQGEPLTIGFNFQYLSEILSNFISDEIIFSMGKNNTAVVIKSEIDDDNLNLIMPMQLEGL